MRQQHEQQASSIHEQQQVVCVCACLLCGSSNTSRPPCALLVIDTQLFTRYHTHFVCLFPCCLLLCCIPLLPPHFLNSCVRRARRTCLCASLKRAPKWVSSSNMEGGDSQGRPQCVVVVLCALKLNSCSRQTDCRSFLASTHSHLHVPSCCCVNHAHMTSSHPFPLPPPRTNCRLPHSVWQRV